MLLAFPQVLRLWVTLGIVVISFLTFALVNTLDLFRHPPEPSFQQDALVQRAARQPADLISLIHSKVHVDFLGSFDKPQSDHQTHRDPDKFSKDDNGTSLFRGAPESGSSTKSDYSRASMVGMSGSQGLTSQVAAEAGAAVAGLHTAIHDATFFRFVDSQHLASTGGITVLVLVLLIGCTCVVAGSVMFPQWFGRDPRRGPNSAGPFVAKERLEQLGGLFSAAPVRASLTRAERGDEITTPLRETSDIRPMSSPKSNVSMSSPLAIGMDVSRNSPMAPPREAVMPPALCPTLVMPMCEARFGIPLSELARVQYEGEINIVGLSGNPLLKAVVRAHGGSRKLEIRMPDQHSAPRATVTPSALQSGSTHESRALEIHGMRGVFYGIMEMRNTGACYVVKDGQSVLSVDGDSDSLQLAIKSNCGLPLASVKCSTEPFGGVDHVEIRVEAGVDTVLVLSVVLSILLLSPHVSSPVPAAN